MTPRSCAASSRTACCSCRRAASTSGTSSTWTWSPWTDSRTGSGGPDGPPDRLPPDLRAGSGDRRAAPARQAEVQAQQRAGEVQQVVRLVQVQDVQLGVATDQEQPDHPDNKVDRADQGADGAGARLGAGRGQPDRADGDVDQVVQRVDAEQDQLVAGGRGEIGKAGYNETKEPDHHVHGSEHLGETAGLHLDTLSPRPGAPRGNCGR